LILGQPAPGAAAFVAAEFYTSKPLQNATALNAHAVFFQPAAGFRFVRAGWLVDAASLSANLLTDIANTQRIVGVFGRRQYLPQPPDLLPRQRLRQQVAVKIGHFTAAARE
jgi:hypothetical protein